MISKHVPLRSGRNSSFGALARYISSAHGKEERVGEIRLTNLPEVEIGDAVALVLATQRANDRVKADKTYHLLISFPVGEVPSPEVLAQIEDRMCAAIGFGDHQRISAVHHDTDNLHVHIAINKIHPTKLTINRHSFDKRVLGETAHALEIEFGLRPDNHKPARTIGEGRAADKARAGGLEPLMDYVKRTCPDLCGAETWAVMHTQLAERGLAIKLQGAGLAIIDVGEQSSGKGVKASSVSRALSKAKLEERLGPFAGPSGPLPATRETYQAEPSIPQRRAPRTDTRALYARYEADCERGRLQRSEAYKAARERRQTEVAAERSRATRNRAVIGTLVPGRGTKQAALSTQASLHRMTMAQISARHTQEAARIKAALPNSVGWLEWLQQQAMAGDPKALAALRERAARAVADKTTAGIESAALPIGPAITDKPDSITKSGTIIYRNRDATVRDDGTRLHVSRGTQDAGVVMALQLARDRHGGLLEVGGDKAFQTRVAALAALHDPTIRFADVALERQRAAFARSIEERQNGRQLGRGPQAGTIGPRGNAGGRGSRTGRADAGIGADRADGPRRAARAGTAPRDIFGIRTDINRGATARAALAGLGTSLSQLGNRSNRQPADAVTRLRLHDLPRGGLADGQGKTAMLLHSDAGRNLVNRKSAANPGVHRQGDGDPRQDRGGERGRSGLSEQADAASSRRSRPAADASRNPPDEAAQSGRAIAPVSAQPGVFEAPVQPGNTSTPPEEPVRFYAPLVPIHAENAVSRAIAKHNSEAAAKGLPPLDYQGAVDTYIDERNAKREAGMDVPLHVPFREGASDMRFGGLRTAKGQDLALVRTGDVIMVLELDAESKRVVSKLTRGDEIEITLAGPGKRIIVQERGIER